MRVFGGVEELRQAVGTHLGYSGWRAIDQSRIDAFAEATGDHQWIHVDRTRAADGPFGGTIAHGYLTLALVPMLVRTVYRVDGVRLCVPYGANKVRFPAPVPVDAKVRAGVELLSVESADGGHRVTTRVTVEVDGADQPACVVDTVSVLVA